MWNAPKYRWILSGALAVGVAGLMPFVAHARDRDEDRSIELRDAPREVVHTIQENSHDLKISELDHVRRGDWEFYRGIVRIHEHVVRDIRVAPDGHLIGMDDFQDSDFRDRERDRDKDFWEHHH